MPYSTKHPAIQNLLDMQTCTLYGRPLSGALALDLCVKCGNKAETFRSALAAKEYEISGYCDTCQDEIFNSEET
jgi:hypothetical protein